MVPTLKRSRAPFMTKFRRRLVALAALPLLSGVPPFLAGRAAAATVTVTVHGVRDGRGHVRIGICPRSDFLSETCPYHAIVSSQAGIVTATIAGVPPGTYAVAAYQDAADAGHLRRSLFGIPEDGTGFSRNPPMRFGPPSFDRCALRIGAQDAAVSITLTYF